MNRSLLLWLLNVTFEVNLDATTRIGGQTCFAGIKPLRETPVKNTKPRRV